MLYQGSPRQILNIVRPAPSIQISSGKCYPQSLSSRGGEYPIRKRSQEPQRIKLSSKPSLVGSKNIKTSCLENGDLIIREVNPDESNIHNYIDLKNLDDDHTHFCEKMHRKMQQIPRHGLERRVVRVHSLNSKRSLSQSVNKSRQKILLKSYNSSNPESQLNIPQSPRMAISPKTSYFSNTYSEIIIKKNGFNPEESMNISQLTTSLILTRSPKKGISLVSFKERIQQKRVPLTLDRNRFQ